MGLKTAERAVSSFPEAFYDVLSYIVPAGYLVAGCMYILGADFIGLWNSLGSQAWFRDLVLLFVVVALLYVIGQVMTTMSWYAYNFGCWLWEQAQKRPQAVSKGRKECLLDIIGDQIITIKLHNESVSLDLTKWLARHVCARNLALSSLVLTLTSITGDNHWLCIGFAAATILFTTEAVVRTAWLLHNTRYVLNELGIRDHVQP